MYTYFVTIIVCGDRKFGQGCMEPCGHCVAMKQCHHVNGSCLNGCDRGYQGIECTEGCTFTNLIKCSGGCTSPPTHSHTKSSAPKVYISTYTFYPFAECNWGYHGYNCNETCQSRCSTGNGSCNAVTGLCPLVQQVYLSFYR